MTLQRPRAVSSRARGHSACQLVCGGGNLGEDEQLAAALHTKALLHKKSAARYRPDSLLDLGRDFLGWGPKHRHGLGREVHWPALLLF